MSSDAAGVLVIDKPGGWTSHDVVAKTRGLTRIRQIGHAGTLDPMATGVLVLCVGKATRLLEYLTGQPKSYRAEITLGITTNTYDAEGEVTETRPVPTLTAEDVDQALAPFRGDILQVPPAYSAIKRDGVASYKRARRGEDVQLAPRPVTIYALDLLSFDGITVQVDVTCSAGTYVRSLAHDLGAALGCGAHLSGLRRTEVASFTLAQATTLEALAAAGDQWTQFLLPSDRAVAHLPAVVIPTNDVARLLHGGTVSGQAPQAEGPVRAYDSAGRLLAIVSYLPDRQAWKPLKVFLSPQD
ncbi:MAG: tRNA pseudouridine(55) synthase TruB [Anaerolineae bacterium]|nr:tRNA pseudouridine(55) synthase TruB [Anaerolineae bacterium]